MAILNVNPTRVSLLSLKKQLKTAERGHKLLKDKRDGLMKYFMDIIHKLKALREEIEEEFGKVLHSYILASSSMTPNSIESNLLFSESNLNIELKTKNVMSVKIPKFSFKENGNFINYGFAQTSGDLDISLKKLEKLLPKLLQLAEIEKAAENLAEEIEKTRRRVNALEYTMIPNIRDTVKFIGMKLGEQERAGILTTMIVKKMIEKKEAELELEKQ